MLQKEEKEGKKDKDGDKEEEDSGRDDGVINQYTGWMWKKYDDPVQWCESCVIAAFFTRTFAVEEEVFGYFI